MDLPSIFPPERRLFTNRTLNMRSLGAVGFDMDYTLIHYDSEAWERRAYEYTRERLLADGYPVAKLEYDPRAFTLGLVIDRELGNVVKANRFGFVKRGAHGTRMMAFDEIRHTYSRVQVDLSESRWEFMNTLFSLSEACLWAQLVDALDAGELPAPLGYTDVHRLVKERLDATHMEGRLKAEVASAPERFVVLDPELGLTLMDLRAAGKRLLLVTNSEWEYTRSMMSHALDPYLPAGQSWRDLFDLVVVEARKPGFFNRDNPAFEIVDEQGLLRPVSGGLKLGGAYVGGNARLVERLLDLPGDQILYVGDHVFADVLVTKDILRWRTCLVLRELEAEVRELANFRTGQLELDDLMAAKELLEAEQAGLRLALQRAEAGYGPPLPRPSGEVRRRLSALRTELESLDARIGPLAADAGKLVNERWGPLMRAGNDKSHLARQVERYADVYTSRVSNFLHHTPFVYLRSPRGTMPHDRGGVLDGSE
jgi:5'-nucleotidase